MKFLSDTSNNQPLIQTCIDLLTASKDPDAKLVLNNLELKPQEIHFLKTSPISKWVDYLIYRYRFKNHIITSFPLHLLIEPTSICNMRCSMCFQHDSSFSSNRDFMGNMSLILFKHIIDEASAKGTKAVTIASRGEPTSHPDFIAMLEYCKDKFFELKINTNATLLTYKIIRQIIECNVNTIVFSCDSSDAEDYKKIRKADKFNIVVRNINRFHEVRKEYPIIITTSRIQAVKTSDEFNEQKFCKFWENIVDEITIERCAERWDTYNNPINNKFKPCTMGLDRLYIWHDGTCNPCDSDYKSHLSFGNVKDKNIEQIWNDLKIRQFRKLHFLGERTKLYPCDRCDM